MFTVSLSIHMHFHGQYQVDYKFSSLPQYQCCSHLHVPHSKRLVKIGRAKFLPLAMLHEFYRFLSNKKMFDHAILLLVTYIKL